VGGGGGGGGRNAIPTKSKTEERYCIQDANADWRENETQGNASTLQRRPSFKQMGDEVLYRSHAGTENENNMKQKANRGALIEKELEEGGRRELEFGFDARLRKEKKSREKGGVNFEEKRGPAGELVEYGEGGTKKALGGLNSCEKKNKRVRAVNPT